MKNVYIIGSKGIPAQYGGFETFVENLTALQKDDQIKYFVSCLSDKANYKFNPNKPGNFQWQFVDDGFLMAVG
ncbi:DUF1972 domain-containing protein [Lactobacillus plantarum]|nr:DUF1972 domain-containing protein [Lactiplantibacillus plantarum]